MNLSPQQIMVIRECARDDVAFAKLLDLYLEIQKTKISEATVLVHAKSEGAEDDHIKIKPPLPVRPAPPVTAKLIGVIDDSTALLDIVRRILEHEGFRVATYQCPLDLLGNDYPIPDLILLDIEMPEMNGAEAMDRFKEDSRFSRTRIVFMTGLVSQEEAAKLSLPGKTAYLSKPFTREALVEQVKKGLG